MRNVLQQLFLLFCALVCLQLPIFVDQYLLRLEGHQAESQRQIDALTEVARVGGKDVDQYITKFLAQGDRDFHSQGLLMQETVERNRFLIKACTALREAGPFSRPIIFLRYLDAKVLAATWGSFTPGLSPTIHVFVFGLAGWLIGWTVLTGAAHLWKRVAGT